MTISSGRRLDPLTSIRFVGAVLVVWLHIKVNFYQAALREWLPWFNVVSLFFVLSGFILSYVYSSGFPHGKVRFLVTRIVRLWPAYLAAIALMCLVTPAVVAQQFTPGKLAATLTMTNTWLPFEAYWFFPVPPAWTVSTEFGLYLCFVFLIYKWERTWLWKLAGSFLVLCGMLLLVETERAQLVRWSTYLWFFNLYVHPLARLFEFTLGMVTFELWRRFGPKINNGLVAGTIWEFAALTFLLLGVWLAPGLADRVTRMWFFGSDLAGLWLLTSSACFGSAALIFVLALEQGLMARLLSCSAAVLLGRLSYAIYLVHWPVLVFGAAHRKDFARFPDWVIICISCALILAIAYLVWAFIEKPCRALLSKGWPAPAKT